MRRFVHMAGADLPLALLAVAFFVMLAFQTVEFVRQFQTLAAIAASQETPLQETARMHQETEALAGDVAKLAESGNADAQEIVTAMARANVVLRPPRPSAAPSPPPDK